MDYVLWGRIEQIAPNEFFVLTTAVEAHGAANAVIDSTVARGRGLAEEARSRLLMALGSRLCREGHRIIDTETDD